VLGIVINSQLFLKEIHIMKKSYRLLFWLCLFYCCFACNDLTDIPTYVEETNAASISTKIAADDLPLNIRNYLNNHFPSIASIDILRHNHQGVISYSVALISGEYLLFSLNGILLAIDRDGQDSSVDQDGNEILSSNLPVAILQYVVENYPNTVILFTEKESDGSYEIYLDNGIELHFDSEGAFIDAENDNDDDGVGIEADDDDDDSSSDSDDDDDDDSGSDNDDDDDGEGEDDDG